MMLVAWRLVRDRHAATAFTGEGAARTGGRWNSRGVAMVYTSQSQSLAALETLVHLAPHLSLRYKVFRVEFDEALLERLPAGAVPADWREEPPPGSTKAVGDRWVREARSAVLGVPSVLIPDEWNFLLNPAHPDFRRIRIGAPADFAFDPRLLA